MNSNNIQILVLCNNSFEKSEFKYLLCSSLSECKFVFSHSLEKVNSSDILFITEDFKDFDILCTNKPLIYITDTSITQDDKIHLLKSGFDAVIINSMPKIEIEKTVKPFIKLSEIKDLKNCHYFVNNSLDMFYRFSSTRGALYWSPRVEIVLGYTHEMLTENPFIWNHSIHPDDIDKVKNVINNFKVDKIETVDYRIKDIDGNYHWIRDSLLKVDKIGEEIIVEGQAYDITDIKEVENELHESQTLLKIKDLAIESSLNAIAIADLKGNLTYVNKSFLNILAYTSHKEVIGKSVLDFWENQHDPMKIVQELFETGFYKGILNAVKADGTIIIVELTANMLYEIGKPFCMIASFIDVTEQKNAILKLKESEEKHRQLFETMSHGIVYHDSEGNIISANPACEKILGLNIENLLYMTSHTDRWRMITQDGEFVPGDEHPAMIALKTGKKIGPVIRGVFVPERDEYVWLSIIATPLFKPDEKEAYQVYAIFEDITEKLIFEDEIRKKDIEFRKLSAVLPDLIFQFTRRLDGSYYVPVASAGIYNIFGCSPEDVKDDFSEILKVLHPDDRERVIADIEYSAQNMSFFSSEYRIQVPERETQWILARSVPEKLPDGSITWYGFSTDITHQKEIQEKYRETNEYLVNLINYANAPIIVWDNNFVITRFNKAFEKLSQYSAEEVIGEKINLLFPLNKVESTIELIERTSSGEKWDSVEIEILRKDKIIRTVLWNSANIYDSKNEKIVNTIAQGQDITDRKKIEKELQIAVNLADKASLAKSEFLANMSHEIRTPLNGIIGFTDLLKETLSEKIQFEYLKYIDTSAHSLLDIINDILDFSKVEAGKLDLDIQKTNILEIINESIEIVSYQANQKGLKLFTTFSDDLPKSFAVDAIRLKQILVNLLGNAVKFTEKGEIELELVFEKLSATQGRFIFSIKDTGIGVTEAQKAKLFKAFSQADTSITRKYGGTGLGLVISNLLAEKMGNSISLESEPDKGSKFSFDFVTEYFNENLEKIIIPPVVNENCFNSIGEQGMKILLVEDVEINLKLVKVMINKILPNAVILEAGNGKKAINIYFENRPDLIFMDIQMPEMDGLEATEIIRNFEKENFRHIPIVALSAGVLKDEIDKCFAKGVDDFLPKPVKFEDLKKTICKYSCNVTNYEKTLQAESKSELTFDVKDFMEKIDNDQALCKDILEACLVEFEKNIKLINTYLYDKDFQKIKKTVHTIKGAALNVSFNKLAYLAKSIEAIIEIEPIKGISLIENLYTEWDVLKNELKKNLLS